MTMNSQNDPLGDDFDLLFGGKPAQPVTPPVAVPEVTHPTDDLATLDINTLRTDELKPDTDLTAPTSAPLKPPVMTTTGHKPKLAPSNAPPAPIGQATIHPTKISTPSRKNTPAEPALTTSSELDAIKPLEDKHLATPDLIAEPNPQASPNLLAATSPNEPALSPAQQTTPQTLENHTATTPGAPPHTLSDPIDLLLDDELNELFLGTSKVTAPTLKSMLTNNTASAPVNPASSPKDPTPAPPQPVRPSRTSNDHDIFAALDEMEADPLGLDSKPEIKPELKPEKIAPPVPSDIDEELLEFLNKNGATIPHQIPKPAPTVNVPPKPIADTLLHNTRPAPVVPNPPPVIIVEKTAETSQGRKPALAKVTRSHSLAYYLLWGLGSLALLGLLAAQYIFFNFKTLAANPQHYNSLQALCKALGCIVPLHAPELLKVAKVRAHTAPQAPATQTRFTFTLTNNATDKQAYPILKLTFLQDKTVQAGTYIAPKDYLLATDPYNTSPDATIAPGVTITGQFVVNTPHNQIGVFALDPQ